MSCNITVQSLALDHRGCSGENNILRIITTNIHRNISSDIILQTVVYDRTSNMLNEHIIKN